MASVTPTLNFLGSKGKKQHPTRRAYYALDRFTLEGVSEGAPKTVGRPVCGTSARLAHSDTISSVASDSDAESPDEQQPGDSKGAVHSTASQVLAKLKDEVTRLIDESIEKIEQDWAEKSMHGRDEPSDRAPPSPPPELEKREENALGEESLLALHPDGDPGVPNHRERNLQVLYSKPFEACKRLTRMKLLDEIHALVDRLKDMEMLEQK